MLQVIRSVDPPRTARGRRARSRIAT